MMIEPLISLTFSMHSNRSVYALLLGSGVSRSAGIPTGWEVVLDLIRKLAKLAGEDCEPDPATWYRTRFEKDPDYSELISEIAKSPTERSRLHKSYFEPNEEEREQRLKVPTAAHKAIASLVKQGYLKVIITTNFDRLLEKSLEDAGVIPTIISTPDAIDGAIPLIHSQCSIIKVNGDYLDTRIKITEEELSQYNKKLNHLLNRVFDEFGLIMCGWSGEWDHALCAAIERCKNHRFTTYWAVKGGMTEVAKRLAELRRAEIIPIKNADSFFSELSEKVAAFDEISKPHPLSAKAVVASLKKYIVDERYKIKLHDLVMGEAEKLFSESSDEKFPLGTPFDSEVLVKRVRSYEALTELVLTVMINGCYWGEKGQEGLWIKCLERIANPSEIKNGCLSVWANLRLYPALLLLYGGGIASMAAGHYDNSAALLAKTRVRDGRKNKPLIFDVYTWKVMDQAVGRKLPDMDRRYTPLSDHLYNILREPMREFLPDDTIYQKIFDRFEYLLALVYIDLRNKELSEEKIVDGWGPEGCFVWRYHRQLDEIYKEMIADWGTDWEDWPILQAGLFGGSPSRFELVKSEFDKYVSKLSWF